jgi:integrase
LYKGVDPKAKLRGSVTLRGALDEYLKSRPDLRPRSAEAYRYSAERYLSDWLDQPLRGITRDMIDDKLRTIAQEVSRSGRHSGNAVANGALRTLRVLYNFAADRAPETAPMPANPVRLRKSWLPVKPRTRAIKPSELPQFYAAVDALENYVARDYLLLLLFTGMRRREAASLRWSDVDFNERVIHIPPASTKSGQPLDLPMSDFVRDLLVARRGLGDGEFVFPANSASRHIEEPRHPLDLVYRACGVYVSAHDLRRVFITTAESCDIQLLALKALVNHSLGRGVTEGYVQMNAERLRSPAQKVADRMKELCGITPVDGDKVKKIK